MEATELFALVDFIEAHAGSIFVREQVNGRWGSYALSELPAPLALHHAFRFIREKHVPKEGDINAG